MIVGEEEEEEEGTEKAEPGSQARPCFQVADMEDSGQRKRQAGQSRLPAITRHSLTQSRSWRRDPWSSTQKRLK